MTYPHRSGGCRDPFPGCGRMTLVAVDMQCDTGVHTFTEK